MWYRTILAQKHTSVIVALWLPKREAKKLAWSKGTFPMEKDPETADSLHITLVHIGKADELASHKDAIREAISHFCRKHTPVTGKVSGIGSFDQEDGGRVIYASFDSADLPALRHSLVECLKLPGVSISEDHGFSPHISLQYVCDGDSMPPMLGSDPLEIRFKGVTLAWAGEQEEFEFKG